MGKVLEEIRKAEKFIKIAMFQIHSNALFSLLNEKVKCNVKVEIITLPYTSVKERFRQNVKENFELLKSLGANVYFNKWNIGDPGRTTTAVEGWYSFHGKFIVTDKSAIILSANFTENPALDALLIYEDHDRIQEFTQKFQELVDLFIVEKETNASTIYHKIKQVSNDEKIFALPKKIDKKHDGFWITDYPSQLCPSSFELKEGIYLAPFDFRARSMYSKMIEDAPTFAYISAETFTDSDFSNFLLNAIINKKIDIQIICGATSQDYQDRLKNQFIMLLAHGIKMRTSDADIHAKMILTDKALAITSVNLNKMSLGYSKRKDHWRGNTETIFICKDQEILKKAKELFLEVFDNYIDMKDRLTESVSESVDNIFNNIYNIRFEDKQLSKEFARYLLKKELDLKKMMTEVAKITQKLSERFSINKIGKDLFVSALILYVLSKSGEQNNLQISSEIKEFDATINIDIILADLEDKRLIIRENDQYRINLEELV